MVKITTRRQFELLVQQMQLHPNIARCKRAYGETRASTESVWREISEKLNSYGPPTRTPVGWQRVWIHFKAKLKIRLQVKNKRTIPTTGGKNLSSLEQAAVDLLQMTSAVKPPSTTFDAGVNEILQQPEESSQASVKIEQFEEYEEGTQQWSVEQSPDQILGIEDEIKLNLLTETDTQAELLTTLQRIEKQLERKNAILTSIKDMKQNKLQIVQELCEIKKQKYAAFLEAREMRKEINHTKLEILKKQLARSNST